MSIDNQKFIIYILKDYLKKINFYYTRILDKEFTDEDLHQFRINIRRSRAILNIFYIFFKRKSYKKINKELANITQLTNKIRDISVFFDACNNTALVSNSDEFPRYFYNALLSDFQKEKKKLHKFLKNKKNQKIIMRYQSFLDKKIDKNSLHVDASLHLNKMIIQYFKEIDRLYKSYQLDKNEKTLHKIRIYLRQIYYLFDSFETYKMDMKNEILFQESKIIQKKLGRFNDLRIWTGFLDTNIKSDGENASITLFKEGIKIEKGFIVEDIAVLLPNLLSSKL